MNVVTGTRASFVNISDKMSTTTDVGNLLADVPKEGTPIFLQTRAAQVIAGIFVWVALFLTCQQVHLHHRSKFGKSSFVMPYLTSLSL